MLCKIAPGSSSPTPSVRSAARATSSRVNQPASATSTPVDLQRLVLHPPERRSPPSGTTGTARAGSPRSAHRPTSTRDLLPDLTSDRALQGLPGSTKPASVENRPSPQAWPRPNRHRSPPSCTTMITAGSVRGKCSLASLGADPDPPGLGLNGGRPADRAMRMPPMPQLQGDGRGQQRSVEIVRRCCDLPECLPLGRPIRSRHGDREVRHLVDDAEQPARRVDVAGGRIREGATRGARPRGRRTGDRPSGETPRSPELATRRRPASAGRRDDRRPDRR